MVVVLLVDAKVDEYLERTEPEEFRVLEAGGEIVSLLRLDRQAQWWLGRALPSAQVHQLATPPQHRGAGHGARLLASLLEELRGEGVPLATLTPSTYPFYRGAGFEVAGAWTWYEARAEHLPRSTAPYRARPVSLDDPTELAAVYRRVAPSRHGALDRDERFWRLLARRTMDKTTAAFVLDGPEGAVGWAVATLEFRSDPAPFVTRVEVADWAACPGPTPPCSPCSPATDFRPSAPPFRAVVRGRRAVRRGASGVAVAARCRPGARSAGRLRPTRRSMTRTTAAWPASSAGRGRGTPAAAAETRRP